jgi:hypothetical protein
MDSGFSNFAIPSAFLGQSLQIGVKTSHFCAKSGPQNNLQLCARPGFKLEAMENQTPEPRESLWRRKLSGGERAELRARPELELEARLTDALAQLPNVPVPSNFTARVLGAIELEEAQSGRASKIPGWHWNWRLLLPRVATTAAVLLFAGLGFQHYETGMHRAEMAQSLSVVASAKTVPSMDALNNFDTIQHISQSGHADTELLADLQ